MEPQLFQKHIDYNRWATNRLLDTCLDLSSEQVNRDFGTADRSVAGTMLHLYRSERIWLKRLKGETGAYAAAEDDWASLRNRWPALHQAWTEWASGIDAAELDRVMEYQDLKGSPRSNVLWQTILHVVNHGTHHRGQVSGFLRALGHVPPPLDYIAFVRM